MKADQLAARVELVENHLSEIQVGKLVAVLLQNWPKTPVIGKVEDIVDEMFQIENWKGTYTSKWAPQKLYDRKTKQYTRWLQWLPKACVILVGFELNSDSKLQPQTKRFLREQYGEKLRDKNINDNDKLE